MAWEFDCAICNDVGGQLVDLAGRSQPKPLPEPQYDAIGSEHQCLQDDEPGDLIIQDMGMGPPYLEVNLVNVPGSIIEGLKPLFTRYVNMRRPPVQFRAGNGLGAKFYKGSLVGSGFKPERVVRPVVPLKSRPQDGRIRYNFKFRIRIIEELEEFFVEEP